MENIHSLGKHRFKYFILKVTVYWHLCSSQAGTRGALLLVAAGRLKHRKANIALRCLLWQLTRWQGSQREQPLMESRGYLSRLFRNTGQTMWCGTLLSYCLLICICNRSWIYWNLFRSKGLLFGELTWATGMKSQWDNIVFTMTVASEISQCFDRGQWVSLERRYGEVAKWPLSSPESIPHLYLPQMLLCGHMKSLNSDKHLAAAWDQVGLERRGEGPEKHREMGRGLRVTPMETSALGLAQLHGSI